MQQSVSCLVNQWGGRGRPNGRTEIVGNVGTHCDYILVKHHRERQYIDTDFRIRTVYLDIIEVLVIHQLML